MSSISISHKETIQTLHILLLKAFSRALSSAEVLVILHTRKRGGKTVQFQVAGTEVKRMAPIIFLMS